MLFESQGEWAGLDEGEVQEFFVDLASQIGLDEEQLSADLDAGTYAEYVQQMFQEAANLQLPGTPAALLDGQLVNSIPDLPVWQQYIDEQISFKALLDHQYDAPPEMAIDESKEYTAIVEMESGDTFTIELLPQSAPETVNSFVFLANEGWFDNVMFHRVLPGFVAQTGDPTGTGRGGPGYAIPNEIDPDLSHDTAGMVAMANSGPDTNGSQWYITLADDDPTLLNLDGSYTIFGRIAEGLEVVQSISPRDPQNPASPPGDFIKSITIVSE